jgi:hypothetical protein
MGHEKLEKVIEKLATSEKTTLVCERAPEGKIRVTSGSWDGEKVILNDQVLQVPQRRGRLLVARKERFHDEWNSQSESDFVTGHGAE